MTVGELWVMVIYSICQCVIKSVIFAFVYILTNLKTKYAGLLKYPALGYHIHPNSKSYSKHTNVLPSSA